MAKDIRNYDFFKMQQGLSPMIRDAREKLELLHHLQSINNAAIYHHPDTKTANEIFHACIGYHNLDDAKKLLKKFETKTESEGGVMKDY